MELCDDTIEPYDDTMEHCGDTEELCHDKMEHCDDTVSTMMTQWCYVKTQCSTVMS